MWMEQVAWNIASRNSIKFKHVHNKTFIYVAVTRQHDVTRSLYLSFSLERKIWTSDANIDVALFNYTHSYLTSAFNF